MLSHSLGGRAFRRLITCAVFAALASLAVSCGPDADLETNASVAPEYARAPDSNAAQEYRFAVHPLHNPSKLVRAYQPLMDHLGSRISGHVFVLEPSRDYANYEEKIRARKPDFLLANPWQAMLAMKHGYVVLAEAGESRDFKGIFIVRRDGDIREVGDLKGRIVAYPARTALAACIMPQWFLHQHGLDVNRDIENRYVGSQESAIMNVYLGQAAAGVTWPPPWRAFLKEHPAEAAKLQVIWETESLVNNAVMAREDLPLALRDRVRGALLDLDQGARGREILTNMETARFLQADATTYEPVRRFVARFEAEVRPIEQR